ncbi:MAG: hypothetical protein Q8S73_02930 [Deltaproteobacteria bacterium]|nr:hypothetical protein [Myxococcales bacterium]MDP3213033.1 hypothetical protein [Deltaproteobacteria bacterium]
MRRTTSWLLLSCLALALSCESAKRRQGSFLAECTFNDECSSPLICAARRCRVECRSDRDCTNDWRCLSAGQVRRYACFAPNDFGSACEYSADCRASWVCADRECRPQCRADYDCRLIAPGLTCLRALGVCSAHPNLTDAGTLPDVDLNDPDGALDPAPPDVPVAVDVPAADTPTADAPDVPVDAGDPFACALRRRDGACNPGEPGCNVLAVGIGGGTRCAVLTGGSVRCWGGGANGTLGNGTRVACAVPGLVSGLVDATEVGVGYGHACARRRGGAGIVCWGQSFVGELGNGTALGAVSDTPTMISATDGDLAVGNSHSCTLRPGASVSCWGTNADGQFGNGTVGGASSLLYFTTPRTFPLAASSLSLGVGHSCGVGVDGTVACWGSGSEGQLGDGTTSHPSPTLVPGLMGVEQVLAGQTHTCARLSGGTVRCWGGNAAGQLGDGTLTTRPAPITPPISGVAELALSYFATCARLTDGTVSCWGLHEYVGLGPVATGPTSPTPVPGLADVTRLYGGAAGFCALRGSEAGLWCWGRAAGNAATGTATAYRPVEVSW